VSDVIPFKTASRPKPFTDDEVLHWLRSQPGGGTDLSQKALAGLWQWRPQRVSKRLQAWQDAGTIVREGKLLRLADVAPIATPVSPRVPSQGVGIPTYPLAAHEPVRGSPVVAGVTAGVLGLVAVGLGALGLVLNARYAASFARTADAALMLSGLGLAIDLLAMVSPAAAGHLWAARQRLSALALWAIWLGATGMMLLATSGFSARELGDAVAGRDRQVTESHDLVAEINRLNSERSRLEEASMATAGQVAAARAAVAAATRSHDEECGSTDHPRVGPNCRQRVAELNQRQDELARVEAGKATADRLASIDTELHEARARLASMPAVSAADPGAAFVSSMLRQTAGVRISEHGVLKLRTLGFTVLPSLSGLLLGFALSVWRSRR
jgi:hypothetical protein